MQWSAVHGQAWLHVQVWVLGCYRRCLGLQDYWHHWQDVTVGFFLGLTVAYLFYRQYFPGLTDAKAGHPYITRLDGELLVTARMPVLAGCHLSHHMQTHLPCAST